MIMIGFATIGVVAVFMFLLLLVAKIADHYGDTMLRNTDRHRDQMLWEVWDKLSSEGQITMGDTISDEISSTVERISFK